MRSGLMLIVLLSVLNAPSALAQTAKPTEAQRAAAKAHFEQAEVHYKLGRFAQALASYTKAYEAAAFPDFLFNIGQCHRLLGNYERASFFYETYIRETDDDRNRRLAERLLAETRAKTELTRTSTGAAPTPSLIDRWWFWPAVGGMAAIAVGGTILAVTSSGDSRSLPPLDYTP